METTLYAMNCPRCGAEWSDDQQARACPRCGATTTECIGAINEVTTRRLLTEPPSPDEHWVGIITGEEPR